jgi:hypothetical protein
MIGSEKMARGFSPSNGKSFAKAKKSSLIRLLS